MKSMVTDIKVRGDREIEQRDKEIEALKQELEAFKIKNVTPKK